MFKKTTLIIFSLILMTGSVAFGQDLFVVELKGLVSVNQTGELWEPARKGLVLARNAAIKTGDQAFCDIAFDKNGQNIASIGPNTEVKVDELFGVEIIRGRVFMQLTGENTRDFKVKTPVAIAGARGTGWETIFDQIAKFSVVDDNIVVHGIDENGNVTDILTVPVNSFLDVDALGALGELGELTQDQIDRLNEWVQNINRNRNINIDYKGEIGKLFTKLLEEELNSEEGAFASEEDGLAGLGGGDSSAPSILGGDISSGTFVPPVEDIIPPVEPPPINKADIIEQIKDGTLSGDDIP